MSGVRVKSITALFTRQTMVNGLLYKHTLNFDPLLPRLKPERHS